ncbi:MAG: hypothetical protein R2845_13405 [Thermomicrobiales bacterium]
MITPNSGVTLRVEGLARKAFNDRWIRGHDFDLIAFLPPDLPRVHRLRSLRIELGYRINPQGWNPGGYSSGTVDNAIRDALNARSLDVLVDAIETIQVTTNDDLFGLCKLGFPQDLILTQLQDLLGFEPVMNWQKNPGTRANSGDARRMHRFPRLWSSSTS